MDIVLDTCAVLWNAGDGSHLSPKAKLAIEEAFSTGGIYISDISFWEIAWLVHNGRLNIETSYLGFINDIVNSYSYGVVSITPEIADIATSLPREINSDPADRIIAATSIAFDAPLVTVDKNLRKSTLVKTIW